MNQAGSAGGTGVEEVADKCGSERDGLRIDRRIGDEREGREGVRVGQQEIVEERASGIGGREARRAGGGAGARHERFSRTLDGRDGLAFDFRPQPLIVEDQRVRRVGVQLKAGGEDEREQASRAMKRRRQLIGRHVVAAGKNFEAGDFEVAPVLSGRLLDQQRGKLHRHLGLRGCRVRGQKGEPPRTQRQPEDAVKTGKASHGRGRNGSSRQGGVEGKESGGGAQASAMFSVGGVRLVCRFRPFLEEVF